MSLEIADDTQQPGILLIAWTWLHRTGSLLAAVAALANFGDRLIDGLGFLVTLVDVYRWIVYPAEELLFGALNVAEANRPSREVIDLFIIILFTRNIVLSVFLRDLLKANGAPRRRAFSDPKFSGIYIDNYLTRVWFPIVLTAFYWVQSFLVREVFEIPVTALHVLFVWGVFGGLRGLFTGNFGTLPRWFIYPYVTYRVNFTGLKPIPSLFKRYHFWVILIVVPLVFELNQRADTALPVIQRAIDAGREFIRDINRAGPSKAGGGVRSEVFVGHRIGGQENG